MRQIDVDRSFVLLADCSVVYDGRAASDLIRGNYLIIHKSDGTLLIHGAALFNPLNYQAPGAVLRQDENRLISTRKKETINITVSSILWLESLDDISNNKIKISKTENDLRHHIVQNLRQLTGIKATKVLIEHPTPYGPLDILAIDEDGICHVLEVKRAKASLAACAQLERYLKYYHEISKPAVGWLLSPEISSGAMNYCKGHEIRWCRVTHQS